jgi:hypothetical protein
MLAAKPAKATEHVDDTALPSAVERARLMAMTARERAELALELGRRPSNAYPFGVPADEIAKPVMSE